MATITDSTGTPGSLLASQRFDAAIEDALADRPARYPNGTAFIGGDLPNLGAILAEEAREGRAMVLVYPDGEEWVIEPRKPASTLPDK
ncbi:MAG TPA: hypothetical protein VK691_09495 [Solirubrobacteraceae bacterium]|jgi:hypothetical protein|nr:hypothetical protein [Solirubrobacteraceae bacterium]